nr:MAG TPA: hypothetical protein [Caudoviricetes sp.]DAY83560.1 MAG TPA: hypothetical protein [Caudoviricetes sp.]
MKELKSTYSMLPLTVIVLDPPYRAPTNDPVS